MHKTYVVYMYVCIKLHTDRYEFFNYLCTSYFSTVGGGPFLITYCAVVVHSSALCILTYYLIMTSQFVYCVCTVLPAYKARHDISFYEILI